MRTLLVIALGAILSGAVVSAADFDAMAMLKPSKPRPQRGDDDPYPRHCVNFSGAWIADNGASYAIKQKECEKLRIEGEHQEQDSNVMLIIPDGQFHDAKGRAWSGRVRHRWNSNIRGTAIETYRWMRFDKKTIEEVTQLEQINENLVLESTYRTIQVDGSDAPQYERVQRVFRRAKDN
jgi:hypothetical protein